MDMERRRFVAAEIRFCEASVDFLEDEVVGCMKLAARTRGGAPDDPFETVEDDWFEWGVARDELVRFCSGVDCCCLGVR